MVALVPVGEATASSVGVSSGAAVVLVAAAVVSVGWTAGADVAVGTTGVGVEAASGPHAASMGSSMRLAANSPADFYIENILAFLLWFLEAHSSTGTECSNNYAKRALNTAIRDGL
jgi:hypothetical protein